MPCNAPCTVRWLGLHALYPWSTWQQQNEQQRSIPLSTGIVRHASSLKSSAEWGGDSIAATPGEGPEGPDLEGERQGGKLEAVVQLTKALAHVSQSDSEPWVPPARATRQDSVYTSQCQHRQEILLFSSLNTK